MRFQVPEGDVSAVIVCTLAALLAWYLIRLLPQSPR